MTGYLNSAAKGVGMDAQNAHDHRYDIADEYMEVVYKLWEGSWEDDAVVRDRDNRIFARPDKVHKIHHEGENYRVDAIHLCEPSPQRTPVLYQAGASNRGCEFAARHAECVFLLGPSKQVVAPRVADIRRRAARYGRNPAEILIFTLMTVIVGRTEAEAKAKFDDYRSHISHAGALTLFSGWTGIDFSRYSLDDPIRYLKNDAINSAVEAFTLADPNRTWTVREIAEFVGHRRDGPDPGRLARADRRRAGVLDRSDRYRRFQLASGDAGELYGFRRSGGAGTAAARGLQARVPRGHVAREALWARTRAAAGKSSGERLPPSCRYRGRRHTAGAAVTTTVQIMIKVVG